MDGSEGSSVPRMIEGRWYAPIAYRRVITWMGGVFIVWGWVLLFLGLNPETSHGSEASYVWFWFVGWNVIGSATLLAARRNAVRIGTEGVDARGLVKMRTYRWDEITGFEVRAMAWGIAIVAVLDSGERRWLIPTQSLAEDRNEILAGLRDELEHRRWRN